MRGPGGTPEVLLYKRNTVGPGSPTTGLAAQVSNGRLPQLIERPSPTGWDSVSLITMEAAQTAQQLRSSVVLFAEFSELHCHHVFSRVQVFGACKTYVDQLSTHWFYTRTPCHQNPPCTDQWAQKKVKRQKVFTWKAVFRWYFLLWCMSAKVEAPVA